MIPSKAMDKDVAIKILEENKKFYNEIAQTFSASRSFIWPEFESIVKYFKNQDSVLDLGCGNGRFVDLFEKNKLAVKYTGLDFSAKLIAIAQAKHRDKKFVVGEATSLPFEDNSFDKILSVAVLHHLPSHNLRLQFLREAKRVLKKDGLLILTSWYLWSNKKYLKTLLKYSLLKLVGRSQLDFKDAYIKWGSEGQRYVHCFTQKELVRLFQEAGLTVQETKFLSRRSGQSNLLIIGQKN